MLLTYEVKKDGVLTDAIGVLLSNEAGTAGVIRTDTSAVVVADGTAMTRIAVGVYSYEFVSVDGVTYEWYPEVETVDGTFRDTLTAAAEGPSGEYYSWTGMKEILGKDNAEVVSQLDGAVNTPDLSRVAGDGETADVYTNFRARNGTRKYTTPIPITSADFKLIQYATNLFASYLLARHRNWFEQTGDAKDRLVNLHGEAVDFYDQLFGPPQAAVDAPVEDDDTPPPGTFQFVTIDRGVCTDADEFASG